MSEFEVFLVTTIFCKPKSSFQGTWKMHQFAAGSLGAQRCCWFTWYTKITFVTKVTTGKE